MAAPRLAKTWEEIEEEASVATLSEMVKTENGVIMYPRARTLFENYMRTHFERPANSRWITKGAISADLFIYRVGIGNSDAVWHGFAWLCWYIDWGFNSTHWSQSFLVSRFTDAELMMVEDALRRQTTHIVTGFLRVLSNRTRATFAASSLGQLPLPADLVQRIGQFYSGAITPHRPVALRPPSYLARVAAIRAELTADASEAGQARAVSQMTTLDADTRGGKRPRI